MTTKVMDYWLYNDDYSKFYLFRVITDDKSMVQIIEYAMEGYTSRIDLDGSAAAPFPWALAPAPIHTTSKFSIETESIEVEDAQKQWMIFVGEGCLRLTENDGSINTSPLSSGFGATRIGRDNKCWLTLSPSSMKRLTGVEV